MVNSIFCTVHSSLENIAFKLVEWGVIRFDSSTGEYYLPHLEEILDAYRVNSEKTYVLNLVDNSNFRACLGSQGAVR